MVLKTKEENRTNAQDKPLRLRVELVHLFPLVVQKLSSLIITEFTKYKSNSGVEVELQKNKKDAAAIGAMHVVFTIFTCLFIKYSK